MRDTKTLITEIVIGRYSVITSLVFRICSQWFLHMNLKLDKTSAAGKNVSFRNLDQKYLKK